MARFHSFFGQSTRFPFGAKKTSLAVSWHISRSLSSHCFLFLVNVVGTRNVTGKINVWHNFWYAGRLRVRARSTAELGSSPGPLYSAKNRAGKQRGKLVTAVWFAEVTSVRGWRKRHNRRSTSYNVQPSFRERLEKKKRGWHYQRGQNVQVWKGERARGQGEGWGAMYREEARDSQ